VELNGQIHAMAALFLENNHRCPFTGKWTDYRVGLEVLEKGRHFLALSLFYNFES
jgi:hypothetical protein